MLKVYNKYHGDAPADAIYCGRGSPYGNPYIIGKDGDRDAVCDKFERNVLPTLDLRPLRGKSLVCYCKPKRCHCDSILLKANAVEGKMAKTRTIHATLRKTFVIEDRYQPVMIEVGEVIDLEDGDDPKEEYARLIKKLRARIVREIGASKE